MVQVEGPPPRRIPASGGRVEQIVVAVTILAAIAWWPYMITWWTRHGWPPYPETYFVGLVVIPGAILVAGRGLVLGLRLLRARWR